MAEKETLFETVGVRTKGGSAPDAGFDEIVALLRRAWTVPKVAGVAGCDPCRSGLDRFVIEDPAFRNFGR